MNPAHAKPEISSEEAAWLVDKIEMLLRSCPFKPQEGPFILDPKVFDRIASPREKVLFLVKRFQLPFDDIEIYLHAGLEQPGRIELSRVFDTSGVALEYGQRITRIHRDGTYIVFDIRDPESPRVTRVADPLPLRYTRLSMYLNNDYRTQEEILAAIIAHETAHLYLHAHRLQDFDSTADLCDRSEERMTDVATFVMGLGEVMLRGCTPRERTVHQANRIVIHTMRLGYLSPEEMRFVHAQVVARAS